MNFALILFLLSIFTGIFWILERVKFYPERVRKAEALAKEFEAANREALRRGEASVADEYRAIRARAIRQPWWLEYTAGLFPVCTRGMERPGCPVECGGGSRKEPGLQAGTGD